MEGFFTEKEIELSGMMRGKILSCASCGLYQTCESPRMKPYGKFKRRILNIGDAPTKADDRTGKPWSGGPGQILKLAYKRLGIDLYEDCLNISAIKCFPGKGASPSSFQINSCRKHLKKVIREYKPEVIVLFGKSALVSVIGDRWKKNFGELNKWRGWAIPDQDYKAWVFPVFHPGYVLVEKEKREVRTVWENDLKHAIEYAGGTFPTYKKPKIEYLKNLKPLKNIKTGRIAFDYETTGLKPHADGHKIICASVATSQDHVYTFMMPDTPHDRRHFLKLLGDYRYQKMAHNMKFEDTWSNIKLRQPVNGWYWDSMLAAHILDNRQGITGLKFQTYVNFGIVDYDSEISSFLHGVTEGGNALNNIHKLMDKPSGAQKLLEYCALDSIYEYRLAVKQMMQMDYQDLPF